MTKATGMILGLSISCFCAAGVQAQEIGGPFSSNPLAYSGSNGIGLDGVFIKPEEFASTPPTEYTSAPPLATTPDYRLAEMFPMVVGYLDLDAMSTGNDVLPIDPATNEISLGIGEFAWGILTYSLGQGNSATGKTQQAFLDSGITGPIPGGLQFSYGIDGSQGIDAQYIDQVWVHLTTPQIESGGNTEVDAIDQSLPLRVANQGVADPVFFPNPNHDFYFSLTAESALALADLVENDPGLAGPFGGLASGQVLGGSIFKISWSAGTGWGAVSVFKSTADLGILATADVDALIVTESSVIFSLADPTAEQINLYTAPSGNVPLRLEGGTKVSTRIGVVSGSSNIDALCARDPEASNFSSFLSTPEPAMGEQIHLSVTALPHPYLNGNKRMVFTVSGWAGAPSDIPTTLDFEVQYAGVTIPFHSATRQPGQQYQWSTVWPSLGSSEATFMVHMWNSTGTSVRSVPATLLY